MKSSIKQITKLKRQELERKANITLSEFKKIIPICKYLFLFYFYVNKVIISRK